MHPALRKGPLFLQKKHPHFISCLRACTGKLFQSDGDKRLTSIAANASPSGGAVALSSNRITVADTVNTVARLYAQTQNNIVNVVRLGHARCGLWLPDYCLYCSKLATTVSSETERKSSAIEQQRSTIPENCLYTALLHHKM